MQFFATSKLLNQPRVGFKRIEKSRAVFKKDKNAKRIV